MENIQFIEPAILHDEMLRLRNERQMDFLECLTGMYRRWAADRQKTLNSLIYKFYSHVPVS